MRVLLDHCVPRPFGALLVGHAVSAAEELGWEQLANGELLKRAAKSFDVFVTTDQNLMHQQHRANLPLPVIVIVSRDTKIEALANFVRKVLGLLERDLERRLYVVPAAPRRKKQK